MRSTAVVGVGYGSCGVKQSVQTTFNPRSENMKKLLICTLVTAFFLQGCSTFQSSKLNFGLEQRKDTITNQTSSSLTPTITWKSDFGGDTRVEKAESRKGLNLDNGNSGISDNLLLLGLGVVVIGALAGKKSSTTNSTPTPPCSLHLPGPCISGI